MRNQATMNVSARIAARSRNGRPNEVNWAATPMSVDPVKPPAWRASTSHASTAPEKNVKPSPMSIEERANAQKGPSIGRMKKYNIVAKNRVTVPSRYEVRRPHMSATTSVGTSKTIWPAV
jgi:hypothetical protein